MQSGTHVHTHTHTHSNRLTPFGHAQEDSTAEGVYDVVTYKIVLLIDYMRGTNAA